MFVIGSHWAFARYMVLKDYKRLYNCLMFYH